jgi:flagellar hook-basal body protein
VGDDEVKASLLQATDDNNEKLYVNKYGQTAPYSEVKDLLVNTKTKMFALDELTNTQVSAAATLKGEAVPTTTYDLGTGINFKELSDATPAFKTALSNLFTVDVDDSGSPVTVDLSYLANKTETYTGEEIATEITNVLNRKFGGERYFDFSDTTSRTFNVSYVDASSVTRTAAISLTPDSNGRLTMDQVVAQINEDLGTVPPPTIVTTQGYAAAVPIHDDVVAGDGSTTFSTVDVTFSALAAGQAVTVNGLTFTATAAMTATEVGDAFASIDAGATSGPSTSLGTYTNKFSSDWASGTNSAGVVTFTAEEEATIIDTMATSTAPGRTETAVITFAALGAGQKATLNGLTFTATAAMTAAQVASAFGGLTTGDTDGNTTGAALGTYSGTFTAGFTTAAWTTGATTVTTTSTSAYTDATDMVIASYGAPDVSVVYDPVSEGLVFTESSGKTVSLATASGANAVMGLSTTPKALAHGLLTLSPNTDISIRRGDPVTPSTLPSLQRYGIKVSFDPVGKTFQIASGTTGDDSSLAITGVTTGSLAANMLGMANATQSVSTEAVRGLKSQPAVATGSTFSTNVSTNFSVDKGTDTFIVTVDDVRGEVKIPQRSNYSLASFISELENSINKMTDGTGKTVNGVKVSYDAIAKVFKFTTGTASNNSFIKVSGSTVWGLSQVESVRGATTTWIKPTQFVDSSSGTDKPVFIDEFGKETINGDGLKVAEWSPLFLDKGELTFDTGGKILSPKAGTQLETVFLAGGKGALTINIDYSKSTQFTSPFAVLSQSQDGAPEGDLVGVTIGVDGLVSASYSNGAQKSLAKILLVNFSSPKGLRQIGDSSFLSSAASGNPILGTAGGAGFGTIRAGATERSNVDLTQELVDLITAQRNFQANAKAIETSTTMTQAIINIRG